MSKIGVKSNNNNIHIQTEDEQRNVKAKGGRQGGGSVIDNAGTKGRRSRERRCGPEHGQLGEVLQLQCKEIKEGKK